MILTVLSLYSDDFFCSIGFDTWAKIGHQPSNLCPTWYGSEDVSMQGNLKNLEIFAVNLLSAELRMRRCERHGLDVNSFEDDVNIVKSMIPLLQNFSDNLHKTNLHELIRRFFLVLCIRMHWLTATFYVWWSQNTSEANNIDDAEVIAILHLQKAIDFIDQPASDPIEIIRTKGASLERTLAKNTIRLFRGTRILDCLVSIPP